MTLEKIISTSIQNAFNIIFNASINVNDVILNETKKEFSGDITFVVFPWLKLTKKNPEASAQLIGEYLLSNEKLVIDFNVVKGFLNLTISNSYWIDFFLNSKNDNSFGKGQSKQKIVLEYCGPNTNKPLHLGHVRNMVLGYSTSNLLSFSGNEVHRVNIYNDRGINICRSMLAWQKYSNGATPESTHQKGDFFVGSYYVLFNQKCSEQVDELIAQGYSKKDAEKKAPLNKEAQAMLVKWEAGDKDTIALWNKMNSWCYKGFNETYKKLGVSFEKDYKESDYYLRGKSLVDEGLKKGVFYKKEDHSVWVDLSNEGLDEKLLLRGDGTSVYLTQDMGIAEARYNDYHFDTSMYVVAHEQDYHFKVLKLVLEKLQKKYAEGIYHLSYGLVNLPSGRMKSREGNVVEADDLIDDMIALAEKHTKELGKIEDLNDVEAKILYKTLGLGALKYFILKVNPKKDVEFNPEESIDFQGNTGPFIQFNYVRIQSLLRNQELTPLNFNSYNLLDIEKNLLKELYKFPNIVQLASKNYDVSEIANYSYSLAKTYSKFYSSVPILSSTSVVEMQFRLQLSKWVGVVLKDLFFILGIEMPNRM